MSKIKVTYMSKEVDLEVVVSGIVQKGNAFLIQCARSGEWCYCSPERMEKLKAKYGSIENVGTQYFSRDARAANKKEMLVKLAAAEAAKKLAEPIAAPKAPVAANPTLPVPPGVTPTGSGKQQSNKKS